MSGYFSRLSAQIQSPAAPAGRREAAPAALEQQVTAEASSAQAARTADTEALSAHQRLSSSKASPSLVAQNALKAMQAIAPAGLPLEPVREGGSPLSLTSLESTSPSPTAGLRQAPAEPSRVALTSQAPEVPAAAAVPSFAAERVRDTVAHDAAFGRAGQPHGSAEVQPSEAAFDAPSQPAAWMPPVERSPSAHEPRFAQAITVANPSPVAAARPVSQPPTMALTPPVQAHIRIGTITLKVRPPAVASPAPQAVAATPAPAPVPFSLRRHHLRWS